MRKNWKLGNLEIWKSRALGLDLWKCGHLEIGKSRALGLDLWIFLNLEPWGWKLGNMDVVLKIFVKLSI